MYVSFADLFGLELKSAYNVGQMMSGTQEHSEVKCGNDKTTKKKV